MRILSVFAAGALLAVQTSAAGPDCRDPQDQATMNMCAARDFQAADGELNRTYGDVMRTLDDERFKAKLVVAQRAWIQFRDNQCNFESADNEGGSLHPLVFAACETRLTKARTKELQDILACWKDATKC